MTTELALTSMSDCALALTLTPGSDIPDVPARARRRPTQVFKVKGPTCRCRRHGCDCAAWEAIYKAKFEDPSYYTLRFRWTSTFPAGGKS